MSPRAANATTGRLRLGEPAYSYAVDEAPAELSMPAAGAAECRSCQRRINIGAATPMRSSGTYTAGTTN